MLSASCSIRVDLPMPGSPPISTSDPATMPPPSTRLNSLSGVSMRCSSLKVISGIWMGLLARWVVVEVAFQSGTEPLGFSMISSTKVFHWLQLGPLPSLLAASKPQLWQKYAILVLANLIYDFRCTNYDYLIKIKIFY